MVLVYIFSTWHKYWYLVIIAGFFHFLTLIFMGALAKVDPGIIPKIFSKYEQDIYSAIPIREDYIDNAVESR